jgi:hypothetical protein
MLLVHSFAGAADACWPSSESLYNVVEQDETATVGS